jgi:hypothetical protein
VRYGTAGRRRAAQHGGDTSNQKKVVTMRPVRILIVAVALIAAAGAGWLLAGGGYRSGDDDNRPAASPTVTQAPQAPPQAAPALDPAPQDPANVPETTRPAPRPRIFGFGSEPVYPREGGFWRLPPGPGQAYLITDAQHATKVEFLLAPTGTGNGGRAVSLGVDSNGGNGYTARWSYDDQPLLAHLIVRATGPGGSAEQTVGIYHPDPTAQP